MIKIDPAEARRLVGKFAPTIRVDAPPKKDRSEGRVTRIDIHPMKRKSARRGFNTNPVVHGPPRWLLKRMGKLNDLGQSGKLKDAEHRHELTGSGAREELGGDNLDRLASDSHE